MVTLGVLCSALCFLASALQLSRSAALVPLVVASFTASLVAVQLRIAFRALPSSRPPGANAESHRERMLIALLAMLIFASYILGFLVSLPLFTAYYWHSQVRGRWWESALAATVVLSVLWSVERLTPLRLWPALFAW